ncbi:MAG: hypothetical protein ACHQEB_07065, partial [Chitinophagales bacterium]
LNPLVRMCHIPVLGHISFKEFFGFFNLPDTEPCGFADDMLKKNRHKTNLRFKIAYLILITETFLNNS